MFIHCTEQTKSPKNYIIISWIQYRYNTKWIMFMDSWNGKASNSHKLILNLPDKVNLKRSDGYIALLNLSIYYTWKNIKTMNLKYQLQHKRMSLNYLMDQIPYQIFKSILSILLKNIKHGLTTLRYKYVLIKLKK